MPVLGSQPFRITTHVQLVGHLHVVTSSLVNIRVSINITIISTIEPINLLLIDILQKKNQQYYTINWYIIVITLYIAIA